MKYIKYIFIFFSVVLFSQNSIDVKFIEKTKLLEDNLIQIDNFDNEYYITDKINDKIDIYIDNFKNNIVEELIFKTKTMNFSNTNRVTIEFENVLIFNDLTPFNYLKRRYEFSGKSRSHSYDELIYSTNTFEVKIEGTSISVKRPH